MYVSAEKKILFCEQTGTPLRIMAPLISIYRGRFAMAWRMGLAFLFTSDAIHMTTMRPKTPPAIRRLRFISATVMDIIVAEAKSAVLNA